VSPSPGSPLPEEIRLRVDDEGVATVTLNRPDRRNAMNRALLGGLATAFADLEGDRAVRVIVVRGEGPAFCAGMDLREMRERQRDEADPESGVTRVLQQIERSRHPTIAMLHGDALAGGCELALHCDLRVAADGVRLGMPLARIGLIVPFPLGQKLVEVIGPAHTRELLLTGRPIDARRAREIGMVHQVVPPGDLEAVTSDLARTIAGNAPLSLAGIKATIARAVAARESIPHGDLDELARRARRSADAREGMAAMLEKRRPAFRGE
jgi:enoyl-CoA hydratase/carnithine racemase